jgi:hypothetical protein
MIRSDRFKTEDIFYEESSENSGIPEFHELNSINSAGYIHRGKNISEDFGWQKTNFCREGPRGHNPFGIIVKHKKGSKR